VFIEIVVWQLGQGMLSDILWVIIKCVTNITLCRILKTP
jgi:hypothetical protein